MEGCAVRASGITNIPSRPDGRRAFDAAGALCRGPTMLMRRLSRHYRCAWIALHGQAEVGRGETACSRLLLVALCDGPCAGAEAVSAPRLGFVARPRYGPRRRCRCCYCLVWSGCLAQRRRQLRAGNRRRRRRRCGQDLQGGAGRRSRRRQVEIIMGRRGMGTSRDGCCCCCCCCCRCCDCGRDAVRCR
jgi:hypothetical protein